MGKGNFTEDSAGYFRPHRDVLQPAVKTCWKRNAVASGVRDTTPCRPRNSRQRLVKTRELRFCSLRYNANGPSPVSDPTQSMTIPDKAAVKGRSQRPQSKAATLQELHVLDVGCHVGLCVKR
jgi:hypothetical protein